MKKKGFTLIELLAVIIVLAIIALIATPMVLNTIEKAREGAAKASAETYMRAIEEYMVRSQLDTTKPQLQAGVKYQLSSKKYEVASIANPNEVFINDLIDIKGDKPESGYVIVTTAGTVDKMEMVMKDYPVTCSTKGCEVKEDTEVKESYEAYAVGDAVTIDGIGYHVTKASGTSEEYVTLLRDESIGNFFFDENRGSNFETSTLKAYLDSTYKATFGDKESLVKEVTLLDFGSYTSHGDALDGLGFLYGGLLEESAEGTMMNLYQNHKEIFFETTTTIDNPVYGEVVNESTNAFWTKTSPAQGELLVGISKHTKSDENFVGYCFEIVASDGTYMTATPCPVGAIAPESAEPYPVRPVVVISKKALD